MENSILIEIENKLLALPVLEQRMRKLCDRISEAENDVKSLLDKYQSEALDVDHIQKDSLSNSILKLIGKYEGKVNKETQEMFTAKVEYDKAVERLKILNLERTELDARLSELYKEKKSFDAELKQREEAIIHNITHDSYQKYMEIQNEKNLLAAQIIETDEALSAANRVLCTADTALQHLRSSENWATYDIWGGGGIISHMAKYEHIDDAQKEFNRLNSQLKDFEKELLDINIQSTYESIGIDSTTRAIDFWLDNIFTDLSVRDKIRDDIDNIRDLTNNINNIIKKLQASKIETKQKLGEAEAKKNALLKSVEG